MLFIMIVQRNASFGKIMYNNERKKFVRKERFVFTLFMLLSFFIVVVRIDNFLYGWNIIILDKRIKNDLTHDLEWICLILMSIMFFILSYYLKKYFKEEFSQNIKNMVFFFIFEVSITVILRSAGSLDKIEKH